MRFREEKRQMFPSLFRIVNCQSVISLDFFGSSDTSCCKLASVPLAMSSSFRLALIQLAVGANKAANVKHACDKVKEAAANGAKVVSLPECFNSPYGTKYFPGTYRMHARNTIFQMILSCNCLLS